MCSHFQQRASFSKVQSTKFLLRSPPRCRFTLRMGTEEDKYARHRAISIRLCFLFFSFSFLLENFTKGANINLCSSKVSKRQYTVASHQNQHLF
ncbi:hypothetical protein I7I50_07355 [Histoplasma capsulatum G186AR]|uniref:Uncharacterized protein n=1 Tax=Ajellomyces capsulatus TaxID=5037 RepID=A0A8H7Z154_AJECA|nr:hypothetical protein I7I52_09573 [Histoplasma capsulatum]QSS68070.1 hypothetical protein I7I50_07355 [Histoplasma capsulatum G186AR]